MIRTTKITTVDVSQVEAIGRLTSDGLDRVLHELQMHIHGATFPRYIVPMQVKLKKLRSSATLPQYQTDQSAGMDLVADLEQAITLQPGERSQVPTGLAIALPAGFEAQVRARSGLAHKHGLTMSNGVGTIDADYRGEIKVLMINSGTEPFTVEPGMRIAQMVIARYERVEWEQVEELDETARGSGGFGHTGL